VGIRQDWLHFYAHDLGFNTTEINYTYYRMPAARTPAAMAEAQRRPRTSKTTLSTIRPFGSRSVR
jgi:hypothetical protein